MENKKNEDKRIERKIPLHFLIGLNVALLLTLAAFEWKTEEGIIVDYDSLIDNQTWIDPPIVLPPPKPAPPIPKKIEIVEVTKEEVDQPKVEIEIDQNDFDDPIPEIVDLPPIKDEEVDKVFHPFEAQPDFEGGMDQFYAFLAKNVKYPASAKRMGIEGKVFVSFIVEPDGSLSNIEIAKSLSPDCDEEALRVIRKVTGFIPGKQRGTPVRVKMTVPIFYKLQ